MVMGAQRYVMLGSTKVVWMDPVLRGSRPQNWVESWAVIFDELAGLKVISCDKSLVISSARAGGAYYCILEELVS